MEDWPAIFKSRDYRQLSVDLEAYERGSYWAFVIPEHDDLARLRDEWDRSRIRPHDRADFTPVLLREAQSILIDRLRDEVGAETENYLTGQIFGASEATEFPEDKIINTWLSITQDGDDGLNATFPVEGLKTRRRNDRRLSAEEAQPRDPGQTKNVRRTEQLSASEMSAKPRP